MRDLPRPYICPFCGDRFMSAASKYDGVSRYICGKPGCAARLSELRLETDKEKSDFIDGVVKDSNSKIEMECVNCGKKVFLKDAVFTFSRHGRRDVDTLSGKIFCSPECKFSYGKGILMNDNPFNRCKYCNKPIYKNKMKEHIANDHPEKIFNYKFEKDYEAAIKRTPRMLNAAWEAMQNDNIDCTNRVVTRIDVIAQNYWVIRMAEKIGIPQPIFDFPISEKFYRYVWPHVGFCMSFDNNYLSSISGSVFPIEHGYFVNQFILASAKQSLETYKYIYITVPWNEVQKDEDFVGAQIKKAYDLAASRLDWNS